MLKPSSEFLTGKVGINPGRAIPLIRPIIKIPLARIEPEFPNDKSASAFPCLTYCAATTKEESFFVLIALTGSSSSLITSVVPTISIWSVSEPTSFLIFAWSPNKINLVSFNSVFACKTAWTMASGAFSPPIASIAIVLIYFHNLF